MERLADQLTAVNENAFVHGSTDGSLYGGRPNTDDWRVTAGDVAALPVADGEPGGDEIEVAPAGRLPFQEASLQVGWPDWAEWT